MMTHSADEILIDRRDGSAIITINRPAMRNAMSIAMLARFNAAVADAESDPQVRAIIICGANGAFCSGLDIADVAEMSRSGNRRFADRGIDESRPAQFANLRLVTKPVIAVVNGIAAGVGLVLALMCDYRIMEQGAAITTSFAKLGLLAEHGTSWLLPRLVGTGNALDLLWTARKVGADEAHAMGLVDRLAPQGKGLDEAEAFVAQFSGSSPHALARIKTLVHAHLDIGFEAALLDADRTVNSFIGHPDVQEGIAAMREKRPPRFKPWPPTVDEAD